LNVSLEQVRQVAGQAVARNDWQQVQACAMEIARQAPDSPDAPFLIGLAQKAAGKHDRAADFFAKALSKSTNRYDAAVELASQNVLLNRYGDACELLDRYSDDLRASPHYLDMAGQAYFAMSLYEQAWPHYELAVSLRPDAEEFQVHMASCAVYVGKIDVAKSIYKKILKKHPKHQRTHYDLSQIERAQNNSHIKQMLKVLRKSGDIAADNIYLYYALGKEYEDLDKWSDAFRYYKKGGKAVKSVADYDVSEDVELIDTIIQTCSSEWLHESPSTRATSRTPIFIVGLPRTGTTLTDRILSSHSEIQGAGESQLLQMVLRGGTQAGNRIGISPDQIEAASRRDSAEIAVDYIQAISHRLGDEPYFVEKLPENVLYLGLIAKAWPNARIVHLRRNPMDACFAMYKQSYFRFAYSLDDLAKYYLAYDRLSRHWRDVLSGRVIEVEYEQLVTDQECQTRRLLEALELPFEEECLHFEQNAAPIATASSVQVREKVHTRSVNKWKRFKQQLDPLRAQLEAGGVNI
jgi:tetratricopeptide (TPR) repeat protein